MWTKMSVQVKVNRLWLGRVSLMEKGASLENFKASLVLGIFLLGEFGKDISVGNLQMVKLSWLVGLSLKVWQKVSPSNWTACSFRIGLSIFCSSWADEIVYMLGTWESEDQFGQKHWNIWDKRVWKSWSRIKCSSAMVPVVLIGRLWRGTIVGM